MPADESFESAPDQPRFETAREALERSSGYSRKRERRPWGEVPQHLRLDWSRALLDFPTFFPGAMWMSIAANTIRADKVSDAVYQWAWQADDFHRVGFTADDWYLLRLCVDRRLDDLLGREDGRFVIDTTRFEYRTITLIAEDWADWLTLRRAGVTPKRALDLLVDGDMRSWPRGGIFQIGEDPITES